MNFGASICYHHKQVNPISIHKLGVLEENVVERGKRGKLGGFFMEMNKLVAGNSKPKIIALKVAISRSSLDLFPSSFFFWL